MHLQSLVAVVWPKQNMHKSNNSVKTELTSKLIPGDTCNLVFMSKSVHNDIQESTWEMKISQACTYLAFWKHSLCITYIHSGITYLVYVMALTG